MLRTKLWVGTLMVFRTSERFVATGFVAVATPTVQTGVTAHTSRVTGNVLKWNKLNMLSLGVIMLSLTCYSNVQLLLVILISGYGVNKTKHVMYYKVKTIVIYNLFYVTAQSCFSCIAIML